MGSHGRARTRTCTERNSHLHGKELAPVRKETRTSTEKPRANSHLWRKARIPGLPRNESSASGVLQLAPPAKTDAERGAKLAPIKKKLAPMRKEIAFDGQEAMLMGQLIRGSGGGDAWRINGVCYRYGQALGWGAAQGACGPQGSWRRARDGARAGEGERTRAQGK